MLAIHLDKIKTQDGRAQADFSIKISWGTGISPNDYNCDAGTEEIEKAIETLQQARHLVKDFRKHHAGKCSECKLDAIGSQEE